MTTGPLTVDARPRWVKSRTYRSGWGWWGAATLVLVTALAAPLTLAWRVVTSPASTTIPTGRLMELFAQTAALMVAVTVTSLTIGTGLSWLIGRTDVAGLGFWRIVAALPLVVPSYMAALTLIGGTGRGGLLDELVGISVPTPYGFTGAWLALSLFLAPMTYLIVSPSLSRIDPALEEAARGLGAGNWRVFRTVTLPQLRPALVSAGLMVGLYTVSDFGAVSLLRYDTFTRAIYTLYAGQLDRAPAATLSVILMAVAVLILFAERRSRTRASYHAARSSRVRERTRLRGGRRWLAHGLLAAYGTVTLLLPISVMVFWLGRGIAAGASIAGLGDEITRSLLISLAAAVAALLAGFPLAMVTTWRRRRYSELVETSTWSVYALPHIAMGVAVVTFALTVARPLYQTATLLVVVYVAMFMAQSMSSIQDSLLRASPDLEDASRGLGRGPLRTLLRVTLPLTTPGIGAAAGLVFISTMKELPATLLLRPNEFETLAIRIWSATGEGFYATASAAGLALLAVSIVPLWLLTRRDLRT